MGILKLFSLINLIKKINGPIKVRQMVEEVLISIKVSLHRFWQILLLFSCIFLFLLIFQSQDTNVILSMEVALYFSWPRPGTVPRGHNGNLQCWVRGHVPLTTYEICLDIKYMFSRGRSNGKTVQVNSTINRVRSASL